MPTALKSNALAALCHHAFSVCPLCSSGGQDVSSMDDDLDDPIHWLLACLKVYAHPFCLSVASSDDYHVIPTPLQRHYLKIQLRHQDFHTMLVATVHLCGIKIKNFHHFCYPSTTYGFLLQEQQSLSCQSLPNSSPSSTVWGKR